MPFLHRCLISVSLLSLILFLKPASPSVKPKVGRIVPGTLALRELSPVMPVMGRISSPFGMRRHPVLGTELIHQGLDFQAKTGTPIKAVLDGKVKAITTTPSFGKMVILTHAGDLETRYAHCDQILVKAGANVTQGEIIATVGATGLTTGAHLHFEVHLNGTPLDPLPWLNGET